MCTVTYLPVSDGEFILTSNRDEKSTRKAAIFPYKTDSLLFPKDGEAGGTWIATSKNKRTVCLLNGAFVKHQRNPPYKASRGAIALSIFEYKTVESFIEEVDLTNIEPFTVIIIDYKDLMTLTELKWDGDRQHIQFLNTSETHFWCSSTLYNQEIAKTRESWFDEWKKNNAFTIDGIADFHRNGGVGDLENDLFIKRNNNLQTISITTVSNTGNQNLMVYRDLLNDSISEAVI